jgi:hypothetical protein
MAQIPFIAPSNRLKQPISDQVSDHAPLEEVSIGYPDDPRIPAPLANACAVGTINSACLPQAVDGFFQSHADRPRP